ncbi:MAG: VWA domain-containing protein [Acidimicrobiales bacterium]
MSRFPFSAVVGAEELKLALVLAAIDPAIGGVLARGDKGSAKTTLARGLAAVLPNDAPFAELPLGATEDRLVGTLDLAAALGGKGVHFEPGLLAGAHGGVLYVDEVNLLADHLVDVLLDVAASGVNLVEREGISHRHPARFVLIGSMNPEEGELRPQLLDRFGLAVDVTTSLDPGERAEAVRRRLAFDADPDGFTAKWAPEEERLRARLAAARPAPVGDHLLQAIGALCASVGAQGLRADLVLARAAGALAGWEGREEATVDDVRRVAALALAHRQRRSPFDRHGFDDDRLDRALDRVLDGASDVPHSSDPDSSDPDSSDPHSSDPARTGTGPDDAGTPEVGRGDDAEARREHREDQGPGGPGGEPSSGEGDSIGAMLSSAEARQVVHLESTRQSGGVGSGRRSKIVGERGRLIGARVPDGPLTSVAAGATLRAAVVRHAHDPAGRSVPTIERSDVRQAVRETTTSNLVVLVLDTSGSMGFERRVQAASGALTGILLDAYQRRDRVALVAFRNDEAEVVLRPTSSIEVARARLATLTTGGRTPLAAGIDAALDLVATTTGDLLPLIVLISDGRATAAPPGMKPFEAALAAADAVRRRGVGSVVVDAEEGPTRLGLASEIAEAMGARLLTLEELSPTTMKELIPR